MVPTPRSSARRGGPFLVRSHLSLVIYCVSKDDQPKETSVRLTRIKPYDAHSTVPAHDFDALFYNDLFLVTRLPLPDDATLRPKYEVVT